MTTHHKIVSSILAPDPTRLHDKAARLTPVTRRLHVDVVDNHFVPNIAFSLPVVNRLAQQVLQALDCHLQIHDPHRWAAAYAHAGAASVTFHPKATRNPVHTARAIRQAGAHAGLALASKTPITHVSDLPPDLDILLIMTVEPGSGGQRLLATAPPAH